MQCPRSCLSPVQEAACASQQLEASYQAYTDACGLQQQRLQALAAQQREASAQQLQRSQQACAATHADLQVHPEALPVVPAIVKAALMWLLLPCSL